MFRPAPVAGWRGIQEAWDMHVLNLQGFRAAMKKLEFRTWHA